MTCDEFRASYEWLLDVEAGRDELEPKLRVRLEAHRASCAACKAEIAATERETRTVLRDLARTVLADLAPDGKDAEAKTRVEWDEELAPLDSEDDAPGAAG